MKAASIRAQKSFSSSLIDMIGTKMVELPILSLWKRCSQSHPPKPEGILSTLKRINAVRTLNKGIKV